jgi:hypothetical protein
VGDRGPHLEKAVPAVDRATLRGSERNRRLDGAERAPYGYFDSLSWKRLAERLHVGRDAFILLNLAVLAALRLVPQSLVGEEELLTSGEDELRLTIYAREQFVGVLGHGGTPCGWKTCVPLDGGPGMAANDRQSLLE